MNQYELTSLLSDLLKIGKDEISNITQLFGGMSNSTYLFTWNKEVYTLRIPGNQSEKFCDRVQEKKNLDLISDLDCIPKTLYYDEKTGIKITKYIEGNSLNLCENKDIHKVSEILQKIHKHPKSNVSYSAKERLNQYEAYVEGVHLEDSYYMLKEFLFKGIQEIEENVPFTLIHGDSQLANFIDSNGTYYITDFEFMADYDPFYDISCYGNNSFQDALDLLPIYLNRKPTMEEIKRVYFHRTFQCVQWYLVATYKDHIGLSQSLKVDFHYYASYFLNNALSLYKEYQSL